MEFLHNAVCFIAAPIINQDNFKRLAKALHDTSHALVKMGECLCLIKNWGNNRVGWSFVIKRFDAYTLCIHRLLSMLPSRCVLLISADCVPSCIIVHSFFLVIVGETH